jgi:hypothetical protein
MSPKLFLVHLQRIAISHLELFPKSVKRRHACYSMSEGGGGGRAYSVWGVCFLYALAIEQESHGFHALPLTFAESRHQFLQLCTSLDFEEDLVVIIGYFYVEML